MGEDKRLITRIKKWWRKVVGHMKIKKCIKTARRLVKFVDLMAGLDNDGLIKKELFSYPGVVWARYSTVLLYSSFELRFGDGYEIAATDMLIENAARVAVVKIINYEMGWSIDRDADYPKIRKRLTDGISHWEWCVREYKRKS